MFWYQFGRTTFPHKYGKKTNKFDYKCGSSVSILLKFAFTISMKVREIIFEPKNAQRRACLDQIIVKAQMTPGSESATLSYDGAHPCSQISFLDLDQTFFVPK